MPRTFDQIVRREADQTIENLLRQLQGRAARLCWMLKEPDCPRFLLRQERRMVTETVLALLSRDPSFVAFLQGEFARRQQEQAEDLEDSAPT